MDYLSTHGHLLEQYDRQPTEADWQAWAEAQPQVELAPQCGQCQHFSFMDSEGKRGKCHWHKEPWHIDKNILLCSERNVFDVACDQYIEAIPF
jgi:hypothetical protein